MSGGTGGNFRIVCNTGSRIKQYILCMMMVFYKICVVFHGIIRLAYEETMKSDIDFIVSFCIFYYDSEGFI